MAARLLSVRHVAPLDGTDAKRLRALIDDGMRLGLGLRAAIGPAEFLRHRNLAFRRWVLETLFVLARGPMGFNALARAVGSLRGESLAVKLQELTARALVDRQVLRESPRRVEYTLTHTGRGVALAGFALALVNMEQVRRVKQQGPSPLDDPPALVAPLPPSALTQETDRYVASAEAFVAPRILGAQPREVVATTQRFAQMCVRRWEGDALGALLEAGPMRFTQLRAALGAGNDALASSLRHLRLIEAVQKKAGQYAITPVGVCKLALGGPVVATMWRAAQ